MAELASVLILMLLAVLLAIFSRRYKIPYPVLLVIGGVLLSLVPGVPRVTLEPAVVFLIFLPPILYRESWSNSWVELKEQARPIALLAILLVLVTTVSVAVVAHALIPQMSWPVAFILGAVVSPSDAVAAVAVTEQVPLPRRIMTILKGESLVNDATGLVTFQFAVAAAVTGAFSLIYAGLEFIYVSAGGILLGLGFAIFIGFLRDKLDDPPVEIALSLLTPLFVYLTAEHLHISGVLAVVAAGLYLGWKGPTMMSPETRLQWTHTWDTIIFMLNGLIFVLLGLNLPIVMQGLSMFSPLQLFTYACAIAGTVVLVRLITVFPGAHFPRFIRPRLKESDPAPPWQHLFVIGWTGMRGIISLAAALAIPYVDQYGAPIPHRELVIFLTFAVIVSTLVFQGLSLPWVIRMLGLHKDSSHRDQEANVRLSLAQSVLDYFQEKFVDLETIKPGVDVLKRSMEIRMRHIQSRFEKTEADGSVEALTDLRAKAISIQREQLSDMRRKGEISEELMQKIQHDLDLEESRLRRSF